MIHFSLHISKHIHRNKVSCVCVYSFMFVHLFRHPSIYLLRGGSCMPHSKDAWLDLNSRSQVLGQHLKLIVVKNLPNQILNYRILLPRKGLQQCSGQLGHLIKVCSCRPLRQKRCNALKIQTSFFFFFVLAHLFDQAAFASFCTSEPWPPWPLSFYHCLFLWTLLMDPDQCTQRSHAALDTLRLSRLLITEENIYSLQLSADKMLCNLFIVEMQVIITALTMAYFW